MNTEFGNKKIDESEFLKERQKVLSMWPTGREVDLDEAFAYHKDLPDHKNFMMVANKKARLK